MQVILVVVRVTARHLPPGLRTTWPYISITICLRLRNSWTSKKTSTQYATLDYRNYIFTSFIKLISSFLPNKIFQDSVKGATSTPRQIQAGVPQRVFLHQSNKHFLYKLHASTETGPTAVCKVLLTACEQAWPVLHSKSQYVLHGSVTSVQLACNIPDMQQNKNTTEWTRKQPEAHCANDRMPLQLSQGDVSYPLLYYPKGLCVAIMYFVCCLIQPKT
jgi:hypothetical protein